MSIHLFQQKIKGFTIGEVVLSSFVMTLGIVAALGLINTSFRTSNDTQDLIIASELAQEGVELARNVRDNDLVDKIATGSPTDVFEDFPSPGGRRCVIDYNDTTLNCGGSPNPQLTFSGGFYQHGVGGTDRFYRLLKIDHVAGRDTALVKSFVTWQDPGSNLNGGGDTAWCTTANKCVYTEVFLTAWQ